MAEHEQESNVEETMDQEVEDILEVSRKLRLLIKRWLDDLPWEEDDGDNS